MIASDMAGLKSVNFPVEHEARLIATAAPPLDPQSGSPRLRSPSPKAVLITAQRNRNQKFTSEIPEATMKSQLDSVHRHHQCLSLWQAFFPESGIRNLRFWLRQRRAMFSARPLGEGSSGAAKTLASSVPSRLPSINHPAVKSKGFSESFVTAQSR